MLEDPQLLQNIKMSTFSEKQEAQILDPIKEAFPQRLLKLARSKKNKLIQGGVITSYIKMHRLTHRPIFFSASKNACQIFLSFLKKPKKICFNFSSCIFLCKENSKNFFVGKKAFQNISNQIIMRHLT